LFTNNNLKNDKNPLKRVKYYKMINPGSNLNLKEAIIRCLVERLQEVTKEELMYRKKTDALYDFWTKTVEKEYKPTKEVFKHFYRQFYFYGDLSFLENGSIVSFDKLKNINNNDFLGDIERIKEICIKNNWDYQVVDCTHKTINFPAVRIIIPPISTDSNPYIKSFIEKKDLEQQFNFLYGIKDFYEYNTNGDWIEDKESIKALIHNIEDALSEDLSSFEFFIKRGPFYQCINLFHLLAFCNLAIGNYDKSLKYFEFLEKNLSGGEIEMNFLNEMFNPSFDPDLYLKYINLIKEKAFEMDNSSLFKFKSNPFDPEEKREKNDEKKAQLVDKFSKSYF